MLKTLLQTLFGLSVSESAKSIYPDAATKVEHIVATDSWQTFTSPFDGFCELRAESETNIYFLNMQPENGLYSKIPTYQEGTMSWGACWSFCRKGQNVSIFINGPSGSSAKLSFIANSVP